MSKVFCKVAYDGTDFFGWQVQPEKLTIQENIESILSRLFANKTIRIEASGRTDAGVHAVAQTFTFTLPEQPSIPNENIFQALNNSLPSTIRITELKNVESSFHARFSAVGKAYSYVINSGVESPFFSRYSWFIPGFNDNTALYSVCELLEGKHDFAAFTNSRKNIDDSIRTIFKIHLQKINSFYILTFVGSGFLYKMVRNITGLLAFVAQGKLDIDKVEEILNARNRSLAPKGAPPNGLFLREVFYDIDSLNNYSPNSLPFLF